jgi:hypothetical protein
MVASTETAPLRVRYFLRIPNVGDRINPLVVGPVAGMPIRFTADTTTPHLLAVGSLMAGAQANSIVWGTGVMHPDMGFGQLKKGNVYAVRGRLSAEVLWRAGVAASDVALGDPGLLVPRILGVRASGPPAWHVGVVPHYVDRSNSYITRLMHMPEVCVLDVRQNPHDFLDKLSRCQTVVSSSLHGLVFGEALGLPTLWCKAGEEIAGADFKFRDWFSTTENPQKSPYYLTGNETPEQLVNLAERRALLVSVRSLVDAFPHQRINEMRDRAAVRFARRLPHRTVPPLPVFIISYNRGRLLQRCLQGLRHLNRKTQPIIHDNGSTDPATLKVLSDLEREGVRIYKRPAINTADELNSIDESVADFFSDWQEPSRYVVTDCDVDMSVADPRALELYDELLDIFRTAECVGPMLRIKDISTSYPLYGHVMNRHIEQFWYSPPCWVEAPHFGRVAIRECIIDTTFALHRAGDPFRRLKPAVRVYEPYEALHLDWYEDCRILDAGYPNTSQPTISHWNNSLQRELRKDEELRFDRFFAVQRDPSGYLEECVCRLVKPS